MQKLCGGPQAGAAAGRSEAQRPAGARNAGQPNRWNRRQANRKRWAAIHPVDCSISRARWTKSGAGSGAVNAVSAAHKLSACLWKRRIQNWPRWYGMPVNRAADAAAPRWQPPRSRAIKNSEITLIPKRR